MRRNGPLLTLAGGGVLAAVLLVASINATGGDDAPDEDLAGDTAATAEPTATPEATPVADPEPTTPPTPPEPVTYVGNVDGGGASVAIVINGAEVTAYVCDGVVEAWLNGTARYGELRLEGENGSLTGSYDDTRATGQATMDGRDWTFTIELVAPPEGLYRVADTVIGGAEVAGGWIVLPDGTQVGVLTVDGETQPAPALDPGSGEVRIAGQDVTAERQG